ncbi:NUDIX hydrolase [Brachybacterium squillarum]|uniref:NUDIX hydrolase n=1 Tax=Brachybacterium squillarum TaxID=661979 RepID=UPI000262A1C3|nr:NUDIX domain-containing protein [Brachybacterium squillarum]
MPTPDFILELREHIGHQELWLTGISAVVLDAARERMLCVRRADSGAWTPVTGILDPGEEPAVAAEREVLEEAGIRCRALRLVDVRTIAPITHPNGDRARYLDLCFLCTHEAGEPHPADGENTEAAWFPLYALPEMNARFREQIAIALSDEPAARFRR